MQHLHIPLSTCSPYLNVLSVSKPVAFPYSLEELAFPSNVQKNELEILYSFDNRMFFSKLFTRPIKGSQIVYITNTFSVPFDMDINILLDYSFSVKVWGNHEFLYQTDAATINSMKTNMVKAKIPFHMKKGNNEIWIAYLVKESIYMKNPDIEMEIKFRISSNYIDEFQKPIFPRVVRTEYLEQLNRLKW